MSETSPTIESDASGVPQEPQTATPAPAADTAPATTAPPAEPAAADAAAPAAAAAAAEPASTPTANQADAVEGGTNDGPNGADATATTNDGAAPAAAAQPAVADATPPNATPAEAAVKLFVGQLPKAYDEAALTPFFERYGNVVSLSVIRDKATGESRGCAFVSFGTRAEADHCIEQLHDKQVMEPVVNPLQVKYATGESSRSEHKLFAGQLPRTLHEDELRQLMAPFGDVGDVVILRDPSSGVGRGCGFVRFATRDQALAAIAGLNKRHRFEGSNLLMTVSFADGPKNRRQNVQPHRHGGYANYNAMGGGGAYYGRGGVPAGAHQPYQAAPGASFYGGGPGFQQRAPQAAGPAYGAYAQGPPPHSGYGYQPQQAAYGAPMGDAPPPGQYHPYAGGVGVGVGGGGGGGGGSQQQGPPGANLFVYGLPNEWGSQELQAAFAPHGNVLSAHVFLDKATHVSKCFGFVSYDSPSVAQMAIQRMNGTHVGSKVLKVEVKRSRR